MNRAIMSEQVPKRVERHDALNVFLGEWKAEGISYGGTDQSGDPKAHGEPWLSTHIARWHTGSFFMLQDERATIAGKTFDTLSIMGVDPESGQYFARTFENHGYYRHYELAVDDHVWTLSGDAERARMVFKDGNRTQVISWEWKRDGKWLPLCDRTAVRTD